MSSDSGDVTSSANVLESLGSVSIIQERSKNSKSRQTDNSTSGAPLRNNSTQDMMAKRLKEMKEKLRIQMENTDWQGAKTTESDFD